MNTSLHRALFILLITLTLTFTAKAQQIKIVEINATALIEDKSTGDYSILIYNDGKLKDSIYCKKSKAMTLSVESNRLYSVVFKKANYPDKIVIVDTKIPTGLRELIEEPFELQVELARKSENLKEDLNDHPIAILTVNRKEKSLMASENYYKLTHN